jgi:aspartyl/asparaginyl-tRNA synthetase
LFRKEKKLTPIHKKEFTVVDIYLREANRSIMVHFFIELLKQIEKELDLQNLSKLPVEYVKHSIFKNEKLNRHKLYWLIVTDYPTNESFYDKGNNSNNETTKFEIYFVNEGNAVELAVGGNLDENLNKNKFVKEENKFVNKKALDKKFIGFGFGVERLIYLYKNFTSQK